MKKILKALSLLTVPVIFLCAFITGCKKGKDVELDNGQIMQDMQTAPLQKAAYEEYSRQALEEYKNVASQHTVDGEIDTENENVIAAANKASAKLFAYACYNERLLDKYVYFSHQEGNTDLGLSGSATALRQEYYLRVNESGNTCGYRYHYTIKKVTECSGAVALAKSLFESARTRITDKTNLLYRLEGDNIRLAEEEHEGLGLKMLECDWAVGKDWGKADIEMKKGGFVEPENIKSDIISHAGEDNVTIRANVNVLADNAVKKSTVIESDDGSVILVMTMNTDVLNGDEASLKMLRKGNDSGNCVWQKGEDDDTGLIIVCGLWGNGLFRFYTVSETWRGKLNGFTGTVNSTTQYYYSYSDRDCDMTQYLEMIEKVNR